MKSFIALSTLFTAITAAPSGYPWYPGYRGGLINADVDANVLGLLNLGLDLNVGGNGYYGPYHEPIYNIPPYY